jgi:hypothetical protein
MREKENWITLATFNWLPEAEILKGLLESEGIETFIPEHHLSTIDPMAIGRVIRVQVRAPDFENANGIYREFQPESTEAQCPSCGSADLVETPLGVRGWVEYILSALKMSPMTRHRKKFCRDCGWKTEDQN